MNDPGARSATIKLPDVWSVREKRFDNIIRQVGWRGKQLTGTVSTVTLGRNGRPVFTPSNGDPPVLILKSASKTLPDGFDCILAADVDENLTNFDPSKARWLRHPALPTQPPDPEVLVAAVVCSWKGKFSFAQEDPAADIVGLRTPQLGALHMVFGHWSATDIPATIVLPTGTGKTDTMIAVLVAMACPRVLVLVPSDALREQLTQKFLDLGVLSNPNSAVLQPGSMKPVVATLEHIPRNRAEVESIFKAANVIVTTSNVPASSTEDIQKVMSELCSHLFIDEAHHAEAPTWRAFKDVFRSNRILQFTATPFREDGQPLDGKIIYNYTLRRAQQDGYFKPITFAAVTDFNPGTSDRTIAKRTVEALLANPKHIAMARVGDVKRAHEVFEIYNEFPEFNPVELHVGIKSASERRKIRQQIVSGHSRIVVCVDMLGEGFDLPELKIAAFHDIRKTLAVTLQLAGRFIRARADLGNATFIANTALVDVRDELRNLYMRDPDWNVLLPQLLENAIGQQQSLQDFLSGFTDFAPEFPIAGVQPALSTVVYMTKCTDWTPAGFRDGIPNMAACAQIHHSLNPLAHTLLIVTARRKQLQWVKGDAVHDWEWELFVVYWWKDKSLLFINGSANASNYLTMAEAIAGESVELIKGQAVFRSFDGITRLQLQNVGLSEQLGRNVRYTGRMGASVGTALTDLQKRKASKSVLAGAGYFDGYKMGIGASRKGRIWTHRRDNLDEFTKWCRHIGTKLIDDNIDEDQILGGTLVPEEIASRPSKYPIAIDWPEVIYLENESYWSLAWGGKSRALSDISMTLVDPSLNGPLRFALEAEDGRLEGELKILADRPGYEFDFSESGAAIGGGRRGGVYRARDFLLRVSPASLVCGRSLTRGQ